MKRLLIGVGLAAVMAEAALAADAPPGRYMPPPRASAYVPFFSWSGVYFGLNAGYGFGQSSWRNSTTTATTGNFDISGALLGGTLGYNMQLDAWVFGIEGDIAWSNIKGSSNSAICFGSCETRNNWLGTARGRVGYAFDRFLPYLTGGAAFGDVKATATGGSFTRTQIGWTAGGGLEYAFFANWSAKLEYLYVDLGTAKCSTTAGCGTASPFEASFTANVVRAGVNYKF
jgi:outer membrane immunogenic protein